MKNISRRVFIKGMAVAAVATAASTVLTGCKLPVGPEEPEVVPTPANSFAFDVDGKKLSVKGSAYISEFVGTADKVDLYFPVEINNGLTKTVKFTTTKPSQAGTDDYYYVVVSAKVSNEHGTVTGLSLDSSNAFTGTSADALDNILEGTNGTFEKSTSTTVGGLAIKGVTDEWTEVVITMKVYKPEANGSTYYYGDAAAEYTFTYNNK